MGEKGGDVAGEGAAAAQLAVAVAGETRLSLLKSSATTTITSATASSSSSNAVAAEHAAPDFFLRLWNSEVGDSFRGAAAQQQGHGPEASAAAAGVPAQALPAELGGDDSSAASTYGTEAAADDDYRAFLDLATEDFALLQGRLGAFSVFPQADVFADPPCCLFAPFE